jgi:hypothetical protein
MCHFLLKRRKALTYNLGNRRMFSRLDIPNLSCRRHTVKYFIKWKDILMIAACVLLDGQA